MEENTSHEVAFQVIIPFKHWWDILLLKKAENTSKFSKQILFISDSNRHQEPFLFRHDLHLVSICRYDWCQHLLPTQLTLSSNPFVNLAKLKEKQRAQVFHWKPFCFFFLFIFFVALTDFIKCNQKLWRGTVITWCQNTTKTKSKSRRAAGVWPNVWSHWSYVKSDRWR